MQCKTLKKHNYTEIEARWQAVVLINQLTLKMLSEAHLHQWRQNIPSWKKVTDIANAFFPFIWTIRGWRGRGIKVFLQRRVFICNTHSCHSFVVLWIKMKDIIKVSNYDVILAPRRDNNLALLPMRGNATNYFVVFPTHRTPNNLQGLFRMMRTFVAPFILSHSGLQLIQDAMFRLDSFSSFTERLLSPPGLKAFSSRHLSSYFGLIQSFTQRTATLFFQWLKTENKRKEKKELSDSPIFFHFPH